MSRRREVPEWAEKALQRWEHAMTNHTQSFEDCAGWGKNLLAIDKRGSTAIVEGQDTGDLFIVSRASDVTTVTHYPLTGPRMILGGPGDEVERYHGPRGPERRAQGRVHPCQGGDGEHSPTVRLYHVRPSVGSSFRAWWCDTCRDLAVGNGCRVHGIGPSQRRVDRRRRPS